jgi:filamentous hemagglutinin family protein
MTTNSLQGAHAPAARSALNAGLAQSTALTGSLARALTSLVPIVAAGGLVVSTDALAQTAPVAPNTLPTGGTIVGGTATISQPDPNKLQITQSSDKAIIDWRSYSIGSQAWVNYTMPGAGSVSLNRVTGGDPSHILGKLTANGTVMLVNPNGVFFGKGATIDVAGLVATTANISNADFMAGKMRFVEPGKPGATVINEGSITIKDAGIAAFVAPGVANRGTIVANLGTVSLASGNTFTLDFYGDGLVRLAVTDPVTVAALGQGQPLVQNSGTITANGGKVMLSAAAAKNVVDTVINTTGVIQARRVSQQADGTIILDGGENGTVNVAGKLDVSAQGTGVDAGKVTVTGEKVRIAGTARIDASAQNGRGGTVKIGGDYQGKGDTRQARIVTVDAGALIDASAIQKGDGGTVVIWSTDTTTFNGIIMAKGGQYAGNGGLVETSGHNLAVGSTAVVDVGAPAGLGGTWLLDPATINIVTGGVDATVAACNAQAVACTIDPTVIVNALEAANNTTVTLTASTSITVSNAVTWNKNGSDLVFDAPTITFNAAVTGTGNNSTNVVFSSNVTVVNLGAIVSAQGGIQTSNTVATINVLSASASIQTGIDIVMSGGTVNVSPGTYTESLTISKSLSLLGTPNVASTLPNHNGPQYVADQPGAGANAPIIVQTGNDPAIKITDGGGAGTALIVKIIGFEIQGNDKGALTAEVGNSSIVAGSSLILSNNTIKGSAGPIQVDIARFETVNVNFNFFPEATPRVVSIDKAKDVEFDRNAIFGKQASPGNSDVAVKMSNITHSVDFSVNIIEGSHTGQLNGQNGLATGFAINTAGPGPVIVNIFNNFFSGLGNDAIRLESGNYTAWIAQNFIGNGVRTDILTNDPNASLVSATIPGYVGTNAIQLDPNFGNGIYLMANAQGTFNIKENFLAGNGFSNNPPGIGGPNYDLNVAFSAAHPKVLNESNNWYGSATPIGRGQGDDANAVYNIDLGGGTFGTVTNPLSSGIDSDALDTLTTPDVQTQKGRSFETFAFQQVSSPPPTTAPPTTVPPTTAPPTTAPPTTAPPTTAPPTTAPPTTVPPTTVPPTTVPPTTVPPTTVPPTTVPPTTVPPTTVPPTTVPPTTVPPTTVPPTTVPPTTVPPTTVPPTTVPPTTLPPRTTVPPPPGQGQGPPFEVPPTADASHQLPWVDLNFIDGLRTSFYMQPNGGPYYYGTFNSLFGLTGQQFGVLRGPLAPQQGAAPPVPSATTLGQLAPAAGPGSTPPEGQLPPDPCAVNLMTNFWAWYTQCSPGAAGPPQQ